MIAPSRHTPAYDLRNDTPMLWLGCPAKEASATGAIAAWKYSLKNRLYTVNTTTKDSTVISRLASSATIHTHDAGYYALAYRENGEHEFHAISDGGLRKHEADEHFNRHFGALDLRKRAAGLDHTDHEKQHEQSVPYGFQSSVYVFDDSPNRSALKGFGTGGEQRPYLAELFVPCGKGILQYFYDPVIAQRIHLFSGKSIYVKCTGCMGCGKIMLIDNFRV